MQKTWILLALALLLTAGIVQAAVTLAWNAPTTGGVPTAYTMYRKVGAGAFVPIGSVPATTLTFTDTAPGIGLNTYRVTAGNTAGESSPSNEVTFQLHEIPGAPASLRLGP